MFTEKEKRMNHTIIHDRAGLNQFYAKVYAFVGLGIVWYQALC